MKQLTQIDFHADVNKLKQADRTGQPAIRPMGFDSETTSGQYWGTISQWQEDGVLQRLTAQPRE
jgi:hypothetical protein